MEFRLRAVQSGDLPVFFEQQRDREAARLAGSTRRDRRSFDEHWHKILLEADFLVRTVEVDGAVAGYVSAFVREGRSHIAYWLGREYWRRGIGLGAVSEFLKWYAERPILAFVAVGNTGSLAILHRCGFRLVSIGHGPDGLPEQVLQLG